MLYYDFVLYFLLDISFELKEFNYLVHYCFFKYFSLVIKYDFINKNFIKLNLYSHLKKLNLSFIKRFIFYLIVTINLTIL